MVVQATGGPRGIPAGDEHELSTWMSTWQAALVLCYQEALHGPGCSSHHQVFALIQGNKMYLQRPDIRTGAQLW